MDIALANYPAPQVLVNLRLRHPFVHLEERLADRLIPNRGKSPISKAKVTGRYRLQHRSTVIVGLAYHDWDAANSEDTDLAGVPGSI